LVHRLTGTNSSPNVSRLLSNIGIEANDYTEKDLQIKFESNSKCEIPCLQP
jgi:hypothetical protein